MHCKTCEYPLWETATRVCPECGTPFQPTDYRFVANAVRFLCPHCRQDYYGTREDGHLHPFAFDCVRCGNPIDENRMLLLPTVGVSEQQTRGGVVPWREAKGIGSRFVAWFKMVWMVCFAPTRVMRAAGQEVRLANAWEFALITLCVFWNVGVGWFVGLIIFGSNLSLGAHTTGWDLARYAGLLAAWVLIPPVAVMLVLAAWGVAANLLMNIRAEKPIPLARTLETFLWCSAVLVPTAIPCFGAHASPFGLIWMCIVAPIMLSERHGIGGGRAAAGVLIPVGVIAALLIAGVVLLASLS